MYSSFTCNPGQSPEEGLAASFAWDPDLSLEEGPVALVLPGSVS